MLRCVLHAARPATRQARALATSAPSAAAEAAAPSAESIAAKVARDVPLTAVPRAARRQARQLARRGGQGAATHGVRTASLPSRVSLALLGGGITGSLVWHAVLDEDTKRAVADALGATPLGDAYAVVASKIEEAIKPWTDPSRTKLLPVRALVRTMDYKADR